MIHNAVSAISVEGMLKEACLNDVLQMLEACRKKKDQSYGLRLLGFIRRCRLQPHGTLEKRLISTLVEIGLLKEALEVYNGILQPNEWSWNTLVTGFAKHGKLEDAFVLYKRMHLEHHLDADATTMVSLLNACGKLKDLERGSEIHLEALQMRMVEENIFVGSTLVDMYCKCGLLAKAEEVLNMLPIRNVVSWTALIDGYVEQGYDHSALNFFEQMQLEGVSPNVATYKSIAKACGNIEDIIKGQKIHADVEKMGLIGKDLPVSNTLIDMYSKCGSLVSARDIFDRLLIRDAVSWTALISGYVERGYGDEALKIFEMMQLESIPPDAVTFVCALKACISIGAMCVGQEMQKEIEKQGLLVKSPFVGSTLVDMYGKHGFPGKAQELFDKLPVRNTISWNALISGHIENGQAEEALSCLEKMKLEGTQPDSVTYMCCLKACGMLRVIEKGKMIHSKLEKNGMSVGLNIVNALIDMYAKCDLLPVSQNIFENSSVRNIVSWNALIAGYVENGYFAEAVEVFEQMQIEGVYPDSVTLVFCLKSCSSIGAQKKAMQIYDEIEKRGLLEADVSAIHAVISMYIECGFFDVAHSLFDRLAVKDMMSWNALIAGHVEAGHNNKVLTCVHEMQLLGISPDVVTYICCLKACTNIGDIEKGKSIHTKIEICGFSVGNSIVGNALIDMYGKCGSVLLAEEVFEKLSIRDSISWTALITGYVEHGYCMEALDFFQQMQFEGISPTATAFAYLLKACSVLSSIEKGREMHGEIERRGLLENDVIVGNALVDMYADCGLLSTAVKIFERRPTRDVISWTALISKYVEYGHPEEAFKCFKQMLHEGLSPDVVTFVCGLKACGRACTTDRAQFVLTEIKKQGVFEKNMFVCNTLVDLYAKCGFLTRARHVFDKIPVKSNFAWNALISGYSQHGHGEEALNCFDEMKLTGVVPDAATFISSLQACGSIGAIDKGLEIHGEIEMRGLLGTDLIGNTVIDMYAKCSAPEKAQRVFEKLPVQDVVSWTALMRGYAHLGESESVLNLFHNMLDQRIRPDPITFVVVLSACSRMGLSNKSWTYFEAMSKDYGINPTHEHRTCIVDLHGRLGQLDRAISIIDKLSSCNYIELWHSMLAACRNLGNKEVGKQAFKHAMSLDERDSAAYVFMSHITAGINPPVAN